MTIIHLTSVAQLNGILKKDKLTVRWIALMSFRIPKYRFTGYRLSRIMVGFLRDKRSILKQYIILP